MVKITWVQALSVALFLVVVYMILTRLFIIALVVSLPIYSANVLAVSVQITKNHGHRDKDTRTINNKVVEIP